MIVAHSDLVNRVVCGRVLRICVTAFLCIFLAVDRADMWWIPIEIRPPDPEFLAVRIDPLPHASACKPSLCACCALHTDEIGRKPMAIAAAANAPTLGAVGGGFVAARERLPVVRSGRLLRSSNAGLQRRKSARGWPAAGAELNRRSRRFPVHVQAD